MTQVISLPASATEPVRQRLPALRQWYLTLMHQERKPGQSDDAIERLGVAQGRVEDSAIDLPADCAIDLIAKAEILDWALRGELDADVPTLLARSLCADVERLCRHAMPYEFDAAAWIDAAIAADMGPYAVIFPDGTRHLSQRAPQVLEERHCPPTPHDPANRAAILDELTHRGLIVYEGDRRR